MEILELYLKEIDSEHEHAISSENPIYYGMCYSETREKVPISKIQILLQKKVWS